MNIYQKDDYSWMGPYASLVFSSMEVSSPRECPHKQEVSQSGLSSPSYDSDYGIESVEHQVAVQQ